MRSVCLVVGLLVVAAPGFAQTSVQKQSSTQQPKLEIVTRQGDFYWVVETEPDGSRKGGWVSAQVPLERIDRTALKALPAVPSGPEEPPNAAIVNERLNRIEQALAVNQRPERDVTTQPTNSVQSTPVPQIAQPQRETSAPVQSPQSREGFWFNAGFGFGAAGCQTCFGRASGASGGLSLGGTVSDRLLFGVGTTGWYKSENGVAVNVGTLDARLRFYPVRTSGFNLTGGLGLGTMSLGVANVGTASEAGVGLMLGLGWDIRIASNVSLSPFYNGFAVRTTNADAYVDQIGLGITIH